MQRYLVDQWSRLLRNESATHVAMVTLICETSKELEDFDLSAAQRRTKSLLRDAGVEYAVGGIDLSFNQDGYDDSGHWCLHLHAIVPSEDRDWEQALSKAAPRLQHVSRPVKIVPFDGSLHGVAYLFKPDVKRRVRYSQTKDHNGKKRVCFNTSEQKLRVKDRFELLRFQYVNDLASQVFLLGMRPTRTADGISIVKLGRKSALAEKPKLDRQKPS